MATGATLLLYTDGLTEARTGEDRELYGHEAPRAFTAGLLPAGPHEVIARNHATAAEAHIALAAVPANTVRILGIVGLDRIFVLHPDAATATGRKAPTGGSAAESAGRERTG